MFGPKIKISKSLQERLARVVDKAGYANVEEMVEHILDREVTKLEGPADGDDQGQVEKRLRGLGYIE